jgi:hypothetical protein
MPVEMRSDWRSCLRKALISRDCSRVMRSRFLFTASSDEFEISRSAIYG